MGQGIPEDYYTKMYGAPSLKDHTEWNAGKCIKGEPTPKMVQPDADLGKSTKPGCRNMVRNESDKGRAFGAPTIRNDIPMPGFRSVADHQNYGDEPEVIDIMFPATALENNVTENDFSKVRTKADLRTLFEKLGYVYRPAKFNAVFNRSVVISGDMLGQNVRIPVDHSTARGLMQAIKEMHNI